MLNIVQARLQQYVNCELPDGFRKGRGIRDQIANVCLIIKIARKFQKNTYCFTEYANVFDYVNHNKLWKILQDVCIPGYLTCLLRNLYAVLEATVRTGHGTTDWFQIGKCGYLRRAVLCYIRTLWVQCAGIFLIDSFPTSDLISHN